MMEEKQIRKNIIALRKKLGLSQEKMAEYLNLSRQAYHALETGPTKIFHASLYKIAERFNVSTLQLLLGYDLQEEELQQLEEMKVVYNQKIRNTEKDHFNQILDRDKKIEELKELIEDLKSRLDDKDQIICLLRKRISEMEKDS